MSPFTFGATHNANLVTVGTTSSAITAFGITTFWPIQKFEIGG